MVWFSDVLWVLFSVVLCGFGRFWMVWGLGFAWVVSDQGFRSRYCDLFISLQYLYFIITLGYTDCFGFLGVRLGFGLVVVLGIVFGWTWVFGGGFSGFFPSVDFGSFRVFVAVW